MEASKYTNVYNGNQTVVNVADLLELADHTLADTVSFLELYKEKKIDKDLKYRLLDFYDDCFNTVLNRLKNVSSRLSVDTETFYDEVFFNESPQQKANRESIIIGGGKFKAMKYSAKEFIAIVKAGKQNEIINKGDFDDLALLSVYMYAKQEKERQAAKRDYLKEGGKKDYASA